MFALALVKSGNAAEAYREAYPKSRLWQAESVAKKAHILTQKAHIQRIVKDARAKANTAAVVTLSECQEALSKIIRKQEPDATSREVRAAVETMAKLQGWNAPDKMQSEVQETREITITIVPPKKRD
jgi:hypothetical protein